MKAIKYIILGIFILSVNSCSVRRSGNGMLGIADEDYFRDGKADPTTIADIAWRYYFNDPILVELIEEGLAYNRNLEVAVSTIRQAETTLAAARAAYFPNVSLVGNVAHNRTSNGNNGKKAFGYHTTNYTLAAAVTWEADIWGKITMQKRADYAAYLGSVEYANLVATSLIANIATTYYTLLSLDSQLEITRETVAILQETTRTMEALMQAGIQTGAAVEQTKALQYGTQVTIPDLEANLRQTENALCVLLGRIPGYVARATLDEQVADTTMRHGIPAMSLARRPDVAQAEWAFRQAWELTGVARAAFYPTLSLSSGTGNGSAIGWTATALSGFFKPENLIASIVGGLTAPLFNGRQIRSNYENAKESQLQALLNFEQTVLEAAEEVSNILYSYESSLSKNPTRRLQVKALETAVYFTEELLKAGVVNYTEVLTARQDLLSARLNAVSDRLEQLQYSVTLYRALGGGLE